MTPEYNLAPNTLVKGFHFTLAFVCFLCPYPFVLSRNILIISIDGFYDVNFSFLIFRYLYEQLTDTYFISN